MRHLNHFLAVRLILVLLSSSLARCISTEEAHLTGSDSHVVLLKGPLAFGRKIDMRWVSLGCSDGIRADFT